MPPRRKTAKQSASDIQGDTDPRAPLDSEKLLAAAKPVLQLLADDLLRRAKASPAVTAALQAQHTGEQKARRTADPFPVWLGSFVDQVAAAWMLSCVFARTLEDRGLVTHARLAGPGAADSQKLFFDLAPSLGERDYLLTVFRELTRFPAARDLFDARHNPVWLLTPSAEAAKALLALFRTPSAEAPTFRFGQEDTRFLGDLYQNLNEAVQKRYALLQTPRFVEAFILDRTLERAIERFGLDEATVIDPTCGSGHFLLGSFERLYEHRLRAEPGLGQREAARKALDAVFGADINPYAVAIAKFRLTLAYLEKAGFTRLEGAPALPLHVVVADSLLHNAQLAQSSFLELEGQSTEAWAGSPYALEDEKAAREVLYRRYAAVVGNPPYITVKDAVLRERYREMYVSAAGKYSLAAPFAERFFQLAREGGSVGMITANSFMKREFGKKLIEEYLPTVNLDLIVNTSGAYIPGHGTPTVLLFGTAEGARGSDVLAVLAKRGEPSIPENAELGFVWRSIAEHWKAVGFENDYISVATIERATLRNYPWSLGGGGTTDLKERLEDRTEKRLADLGVQIGFASFSGEDEVFIGPKGTFGRLGVPAQFIRRLVKGEDIRDWAVGEDEEALCPYDQESHLRIGQEAACHLHQLWRYRRLLSNTKGFGNKSKTASGTAWWEWFRWIPERYQGMPPITYPYVATHNHFVRGRRGDVFRGGASAPIIKLPANAVEDDRFALLAYLNSSTACFWMKQVFYAKERATGDASKEKMRPEADRFEFAATGLTALPIPDFCESDRTRLRTLSSEATRAAEELVEVGGEALVVRVAAGANVAEVTKAVELKRGELLHRLVAIQEDIDWIVYGAFEICETAEVGTVECCEPDQRPFRIPDESGLWPKRRHLISTTPDVAMIETAVFKRPWLGRQGIFGHSTKDLSEEIGEAASAWLAAFAEEQLKNPGAPLPVREIAAALERDAAAMRVTGLLSSSTLAALTAAFTLAEAVPFSSAYRHTESGLEKRTIWERTWDLQRAEDRGEKIDTIPVPPRYDQKDYRDPTYWRLRGKLDVPKERFISYPGCESDQDGEPVYGWAGWNHLQQAQALAALYQKRKTEEAWPKERLVPLLAGLAELLPWIHQWHNDPSDEYGGMRLGDFFQTFLEGELRALTLTPESLRAWRPTPKTRAKSPQKPKKSATPTPEETPGDE